MCKTYDAIYEIRKTVTSDILIAWIEGARVKGTLIDCDCKSECNCKHIEDIVILKDVTVECKDSHDKKELKMLNIPSKWIKAFCFECCVK